MYYKDNKQDSIEQSQNLGIFPVALAIGAGVAALPAVMSLFKKKDKAPKETAAQKAAKIEADKQEAIKLEREKLLKYGLYGLGSIAIVGALILLLRKKS